MAMAAYLSRMARFHASQQNTVRTFSSSSSSSPFSSFRDLKSAIKSEKDPLKVAKLFESSLSIPTFRRYRPLFTLSVHKLSRSKRFDLVDRILTNSITTSPAPQLSSEGFWLRIAMLYSQAGMVDNALQAFDKMLQQQNFTVTEKSLCGVLSVMLDNKIYHDNDKFQQTFEAFVKKTSVSPGVKSFNLMLKAHCKAGRLDEAHALIAKMESEANLQPNIDSYNILLGSNLHIKKRSEFDMVVKKIHEKGLEHNLTTYNHRITRYCKSKECVRARKLLDEMIAKGVEPNSFTYCAIIFAFCKVGDLESARKILEKMVSDGYVKAPSFGYMMLMKHMVEEGEFDGGLEICKDIIQKKWVPPFKATGLLVDGLVKDSKADEAKEIVEKVKRQLRGSAVESWGKIEADLPI
ncbi:pentatricopeptide repeat-containing protein At1g61870, mitochondrial-like [Cynara cardunculus var. scolymus]|uniref:Pentatricopeptide repeat-containing protein n=1 Tax=Cynara cardunculus var. scolymus TaxID=59895 RepID=A0A103YA08_CYNCS|nr:pentatricopeptide repeat-containing protein At1g61870, mitochondrial-like [Cynara cardunculus var. scolymus]KVI05243.1 Pentatricopeptide repeat-containing protein [Cynara cardunculus var. scolymus]